MKETESYLEKDRHYRDRSKKKRLSVDEKRELASNDLKPQHQPYKRKKDWMQLPGEYDDGTSTYHGTTYIVPDDGEEILDPEEWEDN